MEKRDCRASSEYRSAAVALGSRSRVSGSVLIGLPGVGQYEHSEEVSESDVLPRGRIWRVMGLDDMVQVEEQKQMEAMQAGGRGAGDCVKLPVGAQIEE